MDSAYPALLVYAYKYADDFNAALLASVNGGGENVARSACLGSLFGAFYGFERIDKKFRRDLVMSKQLNADIDAFIAVFGGRQSADE